MSKIDFLQASIYGSIDKVVSIKKQNYALIAYVEY